MENDERIRVQVELAGEAVTRFHSLKDMARTDRNADLLRDALRFYEWYLAKIRDGYRVVLVKGDDAREVELVM